MCVCVCVCVCVCDHPQTDTRRLLNRICFFVDDVLLPLFFIIPPFSFFTLKQKGREKECLGKLTQARLAPDKLPCLRLLGMSACVRVLVCVCVCVRERVRERETDGQRHKKAIECERERERERERRKRGRQRCRKGVENEREWKRRKTEQEK